MEHYPLTFEPVLLDKIWGGHRLSELFPDKAIDPSRAVGESWELTARSDHDSIIANGIHAGRTINALIEEDPEGIVGAAALEAGRGRFPLLYKFLDASKTLSVQVHPDDDYGLAHGDDLGKMEAWYILAADPGATIIKGVKPGCSAASFRALLDDQRLEECLNAFEVEAGDCVFLPPRTLHAIGSGLVLFEIQQSSDITYRAYDWGRPGIDGQPRELHVAQVMEVTDFNPPAVNTEPIERSRRSFQVTRLTECSYFVLEDVRTADAFTVTAPEDRFAVLTIAEGAGHLGTDDLHFGPGHTIMLPPSVACTVRPESPADILVSYVPPAGDVVQAGA
ncbi:type I phosphomannose isomerase catalytic subunit [Planctomycetota bacterium]